MIRSNIDRRKMITPGNFFLAAALLFSCAGCSDPGNKKTQSMKNEFSKGTYGYDLNFFGRHNIEVINLKDTVSGASALVVPGWQARVMTSSAAGDTGKSYGWINYRHIESGKLSTQFNPFGGEERFWLGPEGGPFSIYFKKGDEQVFANWKVPAELDTIAFDLVKKTAVSAEFRKDFSITNASGSTLETGIERKIRLLSRPEAENALSVQLGDSISFVAYESENTLTNKGKNGWNEKDGFLSIWMLGMFNPSERGVVFIPFDNSISGKVITDDYFGKVPSDRLITGNGILFFRTDGKYRSKIGISPEGAKPFCGSYDPDNKSLTILWFSQPSERMPYVNSKWGKQQDPLKGDAVNSYNDGPVEDGSIMGPFYEIESSSPAALLAPGGKLTHIQRVFHITGDEKQLDKIVQKIFNVSLDKIKEAF